MPFLELPNEILIKVVDMTHSMDIDNLILANKRLYGLSFSSTKMQRRRATRENAKAMFQRFGNPMEDKTILGRNLDFLDLDDDVSWLKPLHPKVAEESSPYRLRGPVSKRHLQGLVSRATCLGLNLPQPFTKVMGSRKLQIRIPTGGDELIVRRLYRCAPEFDQGAGGCLVSFWEDQQGCCYNTIYLDKQGHHCILWSDLHPYRSDDLDDEVDEDYNDEPNNSPDQDDIPICSNSKEDFRLESTSFEQFLAQLYFEQSISILHDEGLPLTRDLQVYLDHVPVEGVAEDDE